LLFVYESSVLDESGEAFPDMVAGQVAVEHWEKQMSWVVAEQVAVEHWEKQMSWVVAEQVAVEHWEKQMSWVVAEQVAVEHWEKQMSWVVAEQVAANRGLLHVKLKSCFLPLIRDSQGKDSVFSPLF